MILLSELKMFQLVWLFLELEVEGTDDLWDDGDQDYELKILAEYVLSNSVYSDETIQISTQIEDGITYDNETAGVVISQSSSSFSWTNFKDTTRDSSDDQTSTSSSVIILSRSVSENDESLDIRQDKIDFWEDCGSGVYFIFIFSPTSDVNITNQWL